MLYQAAYILHCAVLVVGLKTEASEWRGAVAGHERLPWLSFYSLGEKLKGSKNTEHESYDMKSYEFNAQFDVQVLKFNPVNRRAKH